MKLSDATRRTGRPLVPSLTAHEPGGWLRPVAIALILLGFGTRIQAGPLSVSKKEGRLKYGQNAMHGAVTPPHVHAEDPLPASFWRSPFTLSAVAGPPVDRVIATHSARHLVALHGGETAPGPLWEAPAIDPANFPAAGPGVMAGGVNGTRDHGHNDYFNHMLMVVNEPLIGIIGYSYSSTGAHDPVACASLSSALTGSQCIPPTSSQVFATASLSIDMNDRSFVVSVAVHGIHPFNFVGAQIHAGAAGDNGPAIFDLGPGSQWEDMGGLGISRIVLDAYFPAGYVNALLSGNTYITVSTVAYPAGEIRGQLVAAPSVLWETGAPHAVILAGQPAFLGLSSGSLPGSPQRWAAVPFSLPAAGGTIDRVEADWFVSSGYEAQTVNYIIWQRSGLAAPQPGDERATGTLGPYQAGTDDPRTPDNDAFWHTYNDLGITLPGGDYYFTLYGAGLGDSNKTGFCDAPWLIGGDLQAEELEQPFLWRAASFPLPGFQPFDNPDIQPMPGQDPDDRWNPSFRMLGYSNHFLTVTVPGGLGTVTRHPDLTAYPYGTVVTLTAVPLVPGMDFGGWDGDVFGQTNPLTLVVLKDMNITAVFGDKSAVGESGAATEFSLEPVHPTPSSGPTWIDFAVPRESRVQLSILDVQGRVVARLADRSYSPGRYQLQWDGRVGKRLAPAGMYIVRLEVAGRKLVRKLVIAR